MYSKPKGQEQPQQQPPSSALPYPVYPQNVYPNTGPGFGPFGTYSPGPPYSYSAQGVAKTTATSTSISQPTFYGSSSIESVNQVRKLRSRGSLYLERGSCDKCHTFYFLDNFFIKNIGSTSTSHESRGNCQGKVEGGNFI